MNDILEEPVKAIRKDVDFASEENLAAGGILPALRYHPNRHAD